MPGRLAGGPIVVADVVEREPGIAESLGVAQVEHGQVAHLNGVKRSRAAQQHKRVEAGGLGESIELAQAGGAELSEVDRPTDAGRVPATTVEACTNTGKGIAAGAGVAVDRSGEERRAEIIDALDDVLVERRYRSGHLERV